jgi:HEAT repeat protein
MGQGRFSVALACAGAMVLAGCGNGSPGGSAGAGQKGRTSSSAKETYRFKQGGCDTGEHTYEGPAAEVKRKLCEALQDDELNRGCAEATRREYFQAMCVGWTWTPKYPVPAPLPSASPEPSASPGTPATSWPTTDGTIGAFRATEQLQVLGTVELGSAPGLDALLGELQDCGIRSGGPDCWDSRFDTKNPWDAYGSPEGNVLARLVLELNGSELRYWALVYVIESEGDAWVARSANVVSLPGPPGAPLRESLRPDAGAKVVARLELAWDPEVARKKLAAAATPRALLYAARNLLRFLPSAEARPPILARAVAQSAMLGTSADPRHVEELVDLVLTGIDASPAEVRPFVSAVLVAARPELQWYVAAHALAADPSYEEMKPLARQALSSPDWSIRYDALDALAGAAPDQADQQRIIAMIADPSDSVRRRAAEAAEEFVADAGDLATLLALLKNPDWTVRYDAIYLLQRIPGKDATRALIRSLADDADSNTQLASDALEERQIPVSLIPELEAHFGNAEWSVRYEAAYHLARVPGEEAARALIAVLGDASDSVRQLVADSLEARALGPSLVAPLARHFKDPSWSVRYDAASLIGRIQSPVAVAALKKQLAVEAEESVRRCIEDALERLGG